MSDTPRDDFPEYTYRDELIDDIHTLYGIVTGESSAAQPLDLDFKSAQELDDLLKQMEAAFRRFIMGRVRRRLRPSAATRSSTWTFDAAVRSPISGQDIVERSG